MMELEVNNTKGNSHYEITVKSHRGTDAGKLILREDRNGYISVKIEGLDLEL